MPSNAKKMENASEVETFVSRVGPCLCSSSAPIVRQSSAITFTVRDHLRRPGRRKELAWTKKRRAAAERREVLGGYL